MKYLAVLKDSFREALDSKVLLVLLALSTIVIALAATISVEPLSAEKTFQQLFNTPGVVPLSIVLNVHKREATFEDSFQFSLKKVELLSGVPDDPESEYALSISYRPFPPGMPGGVPPGLEAETNAVRAIFQEVVEYDYLRIKQVEFSETPQKDGGPKMFRVVVQGTPRMIRIWATDISLFGTVPLGSRENHAPLGFQLYFLYSLVSFFGELGALLIGIIITSFFIPNMLRKGTVDLLLAKPTQRWLLFFYKYVGGLTFIFLNMAYAIGGIWLVLGIRTGLWANELLLIVFTVTFFFAILYSISAFIGMITRSTIAAIMVTITAWVCFFGVGAAHKTFDDQYTAQKEREKRGNPIPEDQQWGNNQVGKTLRLVHAILPRTSDLGQIDNMIAYTAFMTGNLSDLEKFDNSKRDWVESILVSLGWILFFLILAALWFTFTDY